jgi:DNA polymerase-1
MAVKTFSIPEEFCVDKAYDPTGTFKPRALMKTGVLAVSYDQSPRSFAKKMNVTDDVAAMFFENFDRTFPSFKTMVAEIRGFMARHGYVETLYGRKRRFPDYKTVAAEQQRNEQRLIRLYTERKQLRSNTVLTPRDAARMAAVQDEIDVLAEKRGLIGYWERAAFNAVIQGTGADILKMNGNRNARICKEREWEFNASIHDEIKNSVPNADLTPETIELIRDIMTNTVTLSVPLVTDIVIEPRWMQEYAPSEWDYEAGRPLPEFAAKYGA